MTTLQKVEFALLFQKQKQDSSIKLRRTIAKSTAFCSFGTGRLHKAGRFRCQNVGRDDRLWPPKLCATEKALCHTKTGKLSQKAQLFAVLAHGVCARHEYFDAKTKLCAGSKLCATTQSKLSKNSAQVEFLCFCVFAGKNAVYLANQSCKDGKSEALCHKKPA